MREGSSVQSDDGLHGGVFAHVATIASARPLPSPPEDRLVQVDGAAIG